MKRRARLGPLAPEEARRFRRVVGLLARPDLEDSHRRAVLDEVGSASFRPLPRIAAICAIEPLLVHHAATLCVKYDDLFAEREPRLAVRPPMLAELAANYAIGRRAMAETLEAFRAAGVGPVVLVKGAALAATWPSPALRTMEDADVVVPVEQRAEASRVLRDAGWQWRGAAWKHTSGLLLDLQVPGSAFARQLVKRATQGTGGAHHPHDADHVVLLALHGARHGGARVWRDVADLQGLLGNGRRAEVAAEALDVAASFGEAVAVSGLLRIVNGCAGQTAPLPARPEGKWSKRDEQRAAKQAALYERLMTDRASEFSLYAFGNVAASPAEWGRRLARMVKGKGRGTRDEGRGAEAGQKDALWGDVAGAGRWERHWAKLAVLRDALDAGAFVYYARLVAELRRVTPREKVFETAKDARKRERR